MKIITIVATLITAALIGGCASDSNFRIDNIPMYGQPEIKRPAFLKQADETFIREASDKLGSREAASAAWYGQGEKYMAEGNLDFAMRRYNQSWLLNPDNYQPYWGFARVMVAAKQYDESFRYFERALALIDDDYQKPALLTDFAIAYHNKGNSLPQEQATAKQSYYSKANQTFESATQADPGYIKAWVKWAYALYYQQDYAAAWDKVAKARALEPTAVPAPFIAKLQAQLPASAQ